jgi:hypothetical protein
MRKNRTVVHPVGSIPHGPVVARRVPQPRRRRLALKAENDKVRAQAGLPTSWIH